MLRWVGSDELTQEYEYDAQPPPNQPTRLTWEYGQRAKVVELLDADNGDGTIALAQMWRLELHGGPFDGASIYWMEDDEGWEEVITN